MKEIILTQNKTTKVDNNDYLWLNSFNWHAVRNKRTFYVCRVVRKEGSVGPKYKYRKIFMHNMIMGGFGNDHKDNDGLNNQRSNLRKANNSQNTQNRRGKINGTSKYHGVHLMKKHKIKIWASSIRMNKKLYHLGYYENEIIAAKAYDKKAIELFGEFANLNFREVQDDGTFKPI
jgi:hypothetical protein